jgi:ubiquinone/menaquinone biosynthesis C-methylase UbiE
VIAASVFDQTVLEAAIVNKSSEGFRVNTWRQKRSVMRRYNLTAEMYDARYCEEQQLKYKAAIEGLSVDGESVVLDVGCGTGLFFSQIAPDAGMVVGADISLELLGLAKENAKKYPDVYLVQADADHLPFKQSIFTHVFAFTVLQNMPNPVKTLEEFKLVAKYDARIVVTGLKAAVSLEVFGGFLEKAGLQVVSLRDDDALRCYVVTCLQQ